MWTRFVLLCFAPVTPMRWQWSNCSLAKALVIIIRRSLFHLLICSINRVTICVMRFIYIVMPTSILLVALLYMSAVPDIRWSHQFPGCHLRRGVGWCHYSVMILNTAEVTPLLIGSLRWRLLHIFFPSRFVCNDLTMMAPHIFFSNKETQQRPLLLTWFNFNPSMDK